MITAQERRALSDAYGAAHRRVGGHDAPDVVKTVLDYSLDNSADAMNPVECFYQTILCYLDGGEVDNRTIAVHEAHLLRAVAQERPA